MLRKGSLMKASIKTLATRTALFAMAVATSANACLAQPNSTRPAYSIVAGQGGYVVLPDTRPAQRSYAFTGEQSSYRQTLQAWQAQAGPVYSVGNALVFIPATR